MLGSAACRGFARAGHDVVGTDIQPSRDPEATVEVADLRVRGQAMRLLEGCEAVVHLGNIRSDDGHEDPAQVYIDNAIINIRTFEAAQAHGTRSIVFASSIQAMGGYRRGLEDPRPCPLAYIPADGGLPVLAETLYGLGKAAGEQALEYMVQRDPKLSGIAIRFPRLDSEYPRKSRGSSGNRATQATAEQNRSHPATATLDPAAIEKERERRRHRVRIDELFTFLLIDDAVSLMLAAVQRQPAGFHILLPASKTACTSTPIADLIRDHYANVPLRRPIEEIESLVDIQPITDLLGWQPSTSLAE